MALKYLRTKSNPLIINFKQDYIHLKKMQKQNRSERVVDLKELL